MWPSVVLVPILAGPAFDRGQRRSLVPVLVHAAHRRLARSLTGVLREEGGQVRATAATDVAALRSAGVFTAGCDPDDEGTLEAALTGVHTLFVLLGGLGSRAVDAVRAEGFAAARAAEGADVARTVLVTLSGSGPDAADPLRRAHGEVAAAFADLSIPTVEVRTGLVDTAAARGLFRAAGLPSTARAVPVAPVAPSALLRMLVAIDAARSRATAGHLVLSADGPTRCDVGAFLDASDAPRTGLRLPDESARQLLLEVLDGPWWTEDPAVVDGFTLLDVERDGR
jgi:hypothetical protein